MAIWIAPIPRIEETLDANPGRLRQVETRFLGTQFHGLYSKVETNGKCFEIAVSKKQCWWDGPRLNRERQTELHIFDRTHY